MYLSLYGGFLTSNVCYGPILCGSTGPCTHATALVGFLLACFHTRLGDP